VVVSLYISWTKSNRLRRYHIPEDVANKKENNFSNPTPSVKKIPHTISHELQLRFLELRMALQLHGAATILVPLRKWNMLILAEHMWWEGAGGLDI
jgi:hypothetical protein